MASHKAQMMHRLCIVVIASGLAVGWASTLHASTPYFVARTGVDTNDCLTLATACQHIRAAFTKASAGDVIIVADGTYTENLTIDKDISLIGFGQDVTIINGGGLDRVMTVTAGTSAEVANVTLTNGAGEAPLWTAGVYVSGTLRLSHSTLITTNDIAIRNEGSFYGNQLYIARNSEGIWNAGTATLSDSIFYTNNVGIHNHGTLSLSNSAVLTNTDWAAPGAGIANYGIMLLDRALIRGNVVLDAHGGGIYNAGALTINDSQIISNTAFTVILHRPTTPYAINASGGGIYNESYPRGIMTITKSALYGNSATTGGDQFSNFGTASLENVTLSGGSGPRGMQTGNATLTNVTISEMPNGVGASSNVVARNTIVNAPCTGPMTSLGHNLDSGNTCGFTATGDLTNTNPLLGPLQDNGGPTPTYAIPASSPAVNAGDNVGCPPTDQRGVKRPQAGRCDIGAYEYVFPVGVYLPFVAR